MDFNNHCQLNDDDMRISKKQKKIDNEDLEKLKFNEFEKLNDDCLMHIFLYLTNVERIEVELG